MFTWSVTSVRLPDNSGGVWMLEKHGVDLFRLSGTFRRLSFGPKWPSGCNCIHPPVFKNSHSAPRVSNFLFFGCHESLRVFLNFLWVGFGWSGQKSFRFLKTIGFLGKSFGFVRKSMKFLRKASDFLRKS